jgi:hypothetical protein
MKFFLGAIIGAILSLGTVLYHKPETLVNAALQRKLEAMEWVIVDHEKEINALKKGRK